MTIKFVNSHLPCLKGRLSAGFSIENCFFFPYDKFVAAVRLTICRKQSKGRTFPSVNVAINYVSGCTYNFHIFKFQAHNFQQHILFACFVYLKEALEHFYQAIRHDPYHSNSYFNLGTRMA